MMHISKEEILQNAKNEDVLRRARDAANEIISNHVYSFLDESSANMIVNDAKRIIDAVLLQHNLTLQDFGISGLTYDYDESKGILKIISQREWFRIPIDVADDTMKDPEEKESKESHE